ncbi:hypothetical protein [Pseudomonas sp. URMO17WK12:I12]|uniref:hypothetical protein n=1 Tax=Pseudomonas sp. URMO17WK12:I12 TaxID=1259797 RepID=UPI0012DE6C6B|nr:hypothetical protein [Pseudomonas sp. URMO17WK12:I12]
MIQVPGCKPNPHAVMHQNCNAIDGLGGEPDEINMDHRGRSRWKAKHDDVFSVSQLATTTPFE